MGVDGEGEVDCAGDGDGGLGSASGPASALGRVEGTDNAYGMSPITVVDESKSGSSYLVGVEKPRYRQPTLPGASVLRSGDLR